MKKPKGKQNTAAKSSKGSKKPLSKPEESNKGGRPSIELTNDMLREIEIGARLGLTIADIAHNLSKIQKISERTLYRRFKDDEDVLAAWERGRVGGKLVSSAALMAMVSNQKEKKLGPDGKEYEQRPFSENVQFQAIKYYDASRGHYTEKKALELTGANGGPVKFELTREQRKKRLKELREKLLASNEHELDD